MKCNIVQEFKGYINNVPFDNQDIYYSAEYILNEIEAAFDIEVPYTLVRDIKRMLQSAWDNLSSQTLGEAEYDFIVCIEGHYLLMTYNSVVIAFAMNYSKRLMII